MKTIKKREDSKAIRMLYSRSNQTEQHGCSASFLSQKFKHKNWLEKIGLKFRDENARWLEVLIPNDVPCVYRAYGD